MRLTPNTRRTGIITPGLACASPAWADNYGCYNLGVQVEEGGLGAVPLAKVNNLSRRVHFVKSDAFKEGCPNASPECRAKAYLIPGDEVVVIGGNTEFVCAGYVDSKGNADYNWLPRGALSFVQERPAIEFRDWIGTWRRGEGQEIRIKPADSAGKLKIEGEAIWGQGAYSHVGEIDAEVAPNGESLSFGMGEVETLPYEEADDVDCRVRMRRLGSYLLVQDNRKCGGLNVSFSDIYRR
jgi:hypothetical protein